jgi:hypothetical protein
MSPTDRGHRRGDRRVEPVPENHAQEKPMFRRSISLALIAGCAILSGGSAVTGGEASPATAGAEVYWRCPTGFTFETSNSAVRCRKPAWTETKAVMPCLAPTPDIKIDLLNHTDMCSGAVGIAVTAEPLCYSTDIAVGFTKRRVSGKDFCGKTHAQEIIAPNQMISF